jgi:hypothetical protein
MSGTAIGLVQSPTGTPRVDRSWSRALVVRHAHEHRLRLVDVLELDDDDRTTRTVMLELAALAGSARADVLVTHGVRSDLVSALADDLGLIHLPVPPHRGRHAPA